MDDHRKTKGTEFFQRLLKNRKRITSPDKLGCGFMNRLKAKLNPDRFDQGEPLQEVKNFRRETVRTGSNGKHLHLRICQSLCKCLFENFQRAVCIRVGLKISNIRMSRVFGFLFFFFHPELFRDGKRNVRREITAASTAAEDTATCSAGAVTVRTGTAGIQGQFVQFFMESLFDIIIQRIIPLFAPAYSRVHLTESEP